MFENLLQNPVYMLGIVAAAVIILIVLVMKFKVNAFVSLLIVSVLSAFAAGMTPGDTLASITGGMGSTLGGITIIVALGAMLGAMLEVSGGAQVMANTLIKTFGINKAPLALVAVGIIVGTPVFLDVAFIILIPVVYSLSKQTKKSVLFFSLPLLAGLAVGHTLIPPTPGPVNGCQYRRCGSWKRYYDGICSGDTGSDLRRHFLYEIYCEAYKCQSSGSSGSGSGRRAEASILRHRGIEYFPSININRNQNGL